MFAVCLLVLLGIWIIPKIRESKGRAVWEQKPAFEVWQYFDAKRQQENFKDVFPEQHKKYAERDNCMDIDTEAILSAFCLACVQKDGKYVNGFRNMK